MDMGGLSGTALMAYMNGMSALQQGKDVSSQALFSAKTGNASFGLFAEILRKSGVQETDEGYASTDDYLSHLKEKYGNIPGAGMVRGQRACIRF